MTQPPAAIVDLDEFRLVRILGQGSMGAVYLGYDTVLERDVAIKVIRRRGVDDDARTRFLTEARAIARLDHPNVITIFRASTTRDGHPYIVQELVRGDSLDRIKLPLAPRRVVEIALGIARGLAAAHRRGILHRDIKPANVMIDDAGTPKLLDFGVAKLSHAATPAVPARAVASAGVAETMDIAATAAGAPIADADTARSPEQQTAAGSSVGTPRYMAPEVWRGQPATPRSDLYSLGVMLYEIVAGRPPYMHADVPALRSAVLDGPPPPAIAQTDLDPELGSIIMTCLARDPVERPESADEIVHRLERILVGAPPVPEGNPYPGLAPFAAERRAVFYGRGTDISAVVDRLRSDPLVVVAGDSGIGKSSLCRAGVLPAITAGGLDDGRTWSARTVTLGRHALATLHDSLGVEPDLAVDEVARALGASPTAGVLVLFDQFEEVVTLNEPREAAAAASIIAELARGIPGIKILVAVRGDFLTRVAALPGLGPVVSRSLHVLRVLSRADARDAVAGPARAKGVRFETGAMVETLASSITDEPGALPLLSFALAELWERRDVETAIIPASAVDAIGGVAGALARHADAVIGALAKPERAAARRIALSLVTGDGTRADRNRRELCPDDDPAATTALEAMIRGRLVVARNTASGEPTYELAHDSLIHSWSTLRGWRDDAAGQRGVRMRLGTAANEWRRLGRPTDALWNATQLREVAELDDIADTDRAFLDASRRAVRYGRIARAIAATSLPAVVVATWLAVRHQGQTARDREVDGHVQLATTKLQDASVTRGDAARKRATAFRLFDANRLADAELEWKSVRRVVAAAHDAFTTAESELEASLLIDASRTDVRAQLTRAIYDHAVFAEEDHDSRLAADIAARLVPLDRDGTLIAAWRKPAELHVRAPRAAHIDIRRYVDRDGHLGLDPPITSSDGTTLEHTTEPGSYLVEIHSNDGLVVVAPVLLARAETLELDLDLPPRERVPDGMVYIPPGRFLYGFTGDDTYRRVFLTTVPLHQVTTHGYLIARTEVTYADWMTYLRALPPAERERRRPRMGSEDSPKIMLTGGNSATELFVLTQAAIPVNAPEGQPLLYPMRDRRREVRWERMPVAGLSLDDATAYTSWLAKTGKVAGARLCNDVEWERAARGADGRTWPMGERIDNDDGNIDVTYAKNDHQRAPDEVGMHPLSKSPFGLDDMLGNAFEWVWAPDSPVQRGGAWWHSAATAESANRDPIEATYRSHNLGLRVCADAPTPLPRPSSRPGE